MDVFDRKAIDQHDHPGIVQFDASSFLVISGEFESATFQTLVVQNETSTCPVKQLDLVTVFVDEQKHISIVRAQGQFIFNQPRQGVKALAHIGRLAVKQVAVFSR